MFDPERLLGQMLGGALGDAFGGQRGRRRRASFTAGGLGGQAQIGIGLLGLAIAAFEHYGQPGNSGARSASYPASAPAMPPPPPPPPPGAATGAMPPPPPAATRPMPVLDERQQAVVSLIRAMIAAANADGHIDAHERESILRRARDGGLDGITLQFLDAEIARPQTLQQVIGNAPPALAAETYAAAALAIAVDTEAERAWLDGLAIGLQLDPAIRADIDARVAA